MIAPAWFLLLVIVVLVSLGLVTILSELMPTDALKSFVEGLLAPITVLLFLAIVIGALI